MKDNIELYKINEILENQFYKTPKELFENEYYKYALDLPSKVLYGFLLDRLTLSKKNNWVNENGEVYLIFTREEVEQKLVLSDKTVSKAFKQLVDNKLIYEKRQGLGKPNLLFIGKIQHEDIKLQEVKKVNFKSRKNSDSGTVKTTTLESENLRPINTDNIKTNNINTDIHQNLQKSKDIKNIEKEKEKDDMQIDFKNNIILIKKDLDLKQYENIMIQDKPLSILLNSAIDKLYYMKELKLSNATISQDKIRSRMYELNNNHIADVVDIFLDKQDTVKSEVGYLATCIYNSLVGNIVKTNGSFNVKNKRQCNYEQREYTPEYLDQFYDVGR